MRLNPLAAVGVAVFATSCSPYNDTIVVRSDPTVDFENYCTYAIQEIVLPDDPVGIPEDLPDDLQANLYAANAEAARILEKKGLEPVSDPANADVVIFSAAASNTEEGVIWECVGDWVWWGWGYVWDPCAWMRPIDVEYQVGTMLVGLADPEMESVVFGGLVQGVLASNEPDPARVQDGAKRVFKQYPGKAKNCD